MEIVKKRKRYLTIPRENIDWFPSVNASHCNGCGKCVDVCPRDVYTCEEGKVKVSHPYRCVVLCTHCVAKCPQQAISFPERESYEKFVLEG